MHGALVFQVLFGEGKRFENLKLRPSIPFELDAVVVVEVVQADHLKALPEQAQTQVKPDKTGGAGNEDRHRGVSLSG